MSDITGVAADVIKPESRFTNDLDCTDLEPVEIILAIEEEFRIAISEIGRSMCCFRASQRVALLMPREL
ncbi:MAG TPA: hypothetical protein VG796_09170 [Verrucomicrobiales bacterium]|nr:hypothetical protein [Verrucomicrobiales bacterium]